MEMTIEEAASRLVELIKNMADGEEVLLTRSGVVVARLIRLRSDEEPEAKEGDA